VGKPIKYKLDKLNLLANGAYEIDLYAASDEESISDDVAMRLLAHTETTEERKAMEAIIKSINENGNGKNSPSSE